MWTSLPNLSGPSPESQVSLNLLFSDITMTPHTRHTGLMSGLAVLSVLIVILPSVVLFLLCKKGEGRRFSHKVNVEMYLHFFWYWSQLSKVGWKCPLFQGISLSRLLSAPSYPLPERQPWLLYYITLNGLPNMFLGSAGCHGSRTSVQV